MDSPSCRPGAGAGTAGCRASGTWPARRGSGREPGQRLLPACGVIVDMWCARSWRRRRSRSRRA